MIKQNLFISAIKIKLLDGVSSSAFTNMFLEVELMKWPSSGVKWRVVNFREIVIN